MTGVARPLRSAPRPEHSAKRQVRRREMCVYQHGVVAVCPGDLGEGAPRGSSHLQCVTRRFQKLENEVKEQEPWTRLQRCALLLQREHPEEYLAAATGSREGWRQAGFTPGGPAVQTRRQNAAAQ